MKMLRLHIIVIEPSQYMSSQINSRMNAIVANNDYGAMKKTLKLNRFLAKV